MSGEELSDLMDSLGRIETHLGVIAEALGLIAVTYGEKTVRDMLPGEITEKLQKESGR